MARKPQGTCSVSDSGHLSSVEHAFILTNLPGLSRSLDSLLAPTLILRIHVHLEFRT